MVRERPRMEKPIVKVKLIHPLATLPLRAHTTDAGADLYSVEPVALGPSESAMVPTGLILEIPPGYEGQIRPRSGLAVRDQVTVLNAPGTIDAGYRGEVKVLLINHAEYAVLYTANTRIAQLVIAPVALATFEQAATLDETERGQGGFGSTGVK